MWKLTLSVILIASTILAEHIEKDAQISSYQSDIHPDGSYLYAFETTNGIVQQEQGVGGVGSSGTSQYVDPEGHVIKTTYTADENGYLPQGSHLAGISEAILRSIEWNKAHPEEDDYLHPELRGAVHGGIQGGIQGDLRGDIRGDIRADLRGDIRGDLQGVIRGDLPADIRGDLRSDIHGNGRLNVRGDFLDNIRGDIPSGIQGDIRRTYKSELPVVNVQTPPSAHY